MATIIFAQSHFEVFLLGHKIKILTDHQALVTGYLSYMKGQSRRLLLRWYIKIAQFIPDLTSKCKSGRAGCKCSFTCTCLNIGPVFEWNSVTMCTLNCRGGITTEHLITAVCDINFIVKSYQKILRKHRK